MQVPSPFAKSESLQRLWTYVLALALVLLALLVRLNVSLPFYGPVLVIFTMPIILSAYWGGVGPGLLATAASVLAASYYLLPPIHSFAVASSAQVLQQVMLAAAGLLISVICEALHRANSGAIADKAKAQSGQMAAARLAAIVESSMDAIIAKDLDGVITSWNAAARGTFGYEPAEAIGRHISLLIPPDRLAEEEMIISRLRAGQHIDHYETVRLHKDGAEVFVSLSVSPIFDAKGHITGASKIARDITEKKRSEAHLQVVQSELAHVARLSAMSQMSAAIAHELNQPLTAVVNYVSAAQRMLSSKDFTPQKQAGVLEAMEKASAQTLRAGSIIQHLREFVEKREAEKGREDLNLIVEEAITLGFVGATDVNVKVKRELSRLPLPVRVNRIQVQQVLINLIRNGIEAMNQSPQRIMTLVTGGDGNFAFVTIRDTGPGLPAEVRANLFQPFVTTKEQGMGIGLNICQSIVEAHGGNILAPVVSEGGAVFRIRLPLDLPEVVAET